MLRTTGVAPIDLVKERFPNKQRYQKKAVAFIECYQDIPCNPCVTSCPFDAIEIIGEITNQPKVLPDLCTGCGICEKVCIVEKPAIKVFPGKSATGEIGDHYIRSWIEGDEQRMNLGKDNITPDENLKSAMDYLNADDIIEDK